MGENHHKYMYQVLAILSAVSNYLKTENITNTIIISKNSRIFNGVGKSNWRIKFILVIRGHLKN